MHKSLLVISSVLLTATAASHAALVVIDGSTLGASQTLLNGDSAFIDIDGDGTADVGIQNFAQIDNYRYIAAVSPPSTDGRTESSIATVNAAAEFIFSFAVGPIIQSGINYASNMDAVDSTDSFTNETAYLAGASAFANENAEAQWVDPMTNPVTGALAVRFESSTITGTAEIISGFVNLTFDNQPFNAQTVTINSFGYFDPVPEPSSALLLGFGALVAMRRKR